MEDTNWEAAVAAAAAHAFKGETMADQKKKIQLEDITPANMLIADPTVPGGWRVDPEKSKIVAAAIQESYKKPE
jgi:hypothetical protein